MTLEFVMLAIAAYLLGSVPAAYLAARWSRGIDLRQFGTGNVGGSNLIKATSIRIAIPVFIYDFLKGAAPVWLAQAIGLTAYAQLAVGICAVIGHNWPVFLRFQGGRGILTSEAVIFAVSPLLGVITLVTAYAFAPFRHWAYLLASSHCRCGATLPPDGWASRRDGPQQRALSCWWQSVLSGGCGCRGRP